MEAEILLAHALEVDRLHLYLAPDKPLTTDERTRYRTVIQKRHEGTPLQHIIGEVSFYGLRFKVSREALIPRAETEELLDHVLKQAPRDRPIRCLDLGTGTGVIAVCLARYLPSASITAVDASPAALALAKANAKLNSVEARIDFLESHWFTRVEGCFDLIVSNPPYVSAEDLVSLPREVREHEPSVALNGGESGLESIASILASMPVHLAPDGLVLMEIGGTQGPDVVKLMQVAGLEAASVEQDMAGKDRFAMARRPS